MSNLTSILLMLATFGFMLLVLALFFTRAHERMDEIVTGVVNGVPVSTRYRWLLLLYDYLGYALACVVLLSVFGIGFFSAADGLTDPRLETLAYFCGSASAWGAVGVVVFVAAWVFYMVSLLRREKRN